MQFDVYCDESRPELFSSKNPNAQYLVIGSLWLETESRDSLKTAIHDLRNAHKVGGEFKWQKVSPSRCAFYEALMKWFVDQQLDLRFRCIAVDRTKVDLMHYHESDQELGFYKFYYQMLLHWILDWNEYHVFCDYKSNRIRDRLHVLQRCLGYANLSSTIHCVQAVRSRESVLLQLSDVLTGLAAARINGIHLSQAKEGVTKTLESGLGRSIGPTPKGEQKFNIFQIQLQGGW